MSDVCIPAADAASIPAGATDGSEGHSLALVVGDYGEPIPLEAAECRYFVQSNGANVAYFHIAEDAALYAAAPDLLEALRYVVRIHGEWGVAPENQPHEISVAMEAIAKATTAPSMGNGDE